ncbi:hypothetical protein K2173_006011 [Erythroxylum novogranatense]|uniref:non-specific serine/threonine protein kinase n=1 Tax=Erythroxylum novogranatense TaxID=1862640 RepID=A0AAV8TBT3_9ROSI|nr:hypothetical protein K2173_006011 [Erythroxylum novogranatense]
MSGATPPDSRSPPSPTAQSPSDSSSQPVDSPPPQSSNSPPSPPTESSPPSFAPKSPPPPPPPPPPTSSSSSSSPPAPSSDNNGGSGRSSPKSSSSDSTPRNSSPKSSETNGPSSDQKVIIGVVVGVGVLLIVMVIICAICCRKKRRKKEIIPYYADYPPKSSQKYYNSKKTDWNNSPAPPADHVFKIPPASPGPGWKGSPNPAPGVMSGGDTSTTHPGLSHPPLPPPSPNIALGLNQSMFSYEQLALATNGFSDANVLGQGGFGYVHKGVLPNGKEVAVKSLKSGSGQGEREFQAEVEIISRVHHRHLVSLEGYCIASGQRMLVYEFVPNKTLEYHLHGKDLPVMDWPTRLRIALGSAKGLAYLHEDCHPRIIHRDIKSANILLDFNFEAMVADFGLAKLSSDNYTHVSTRVMGTFGYLAPEYASSGKLTDKSDVFSFGVMLLEIITGKRPVDANNAMDDGLVDWARPFLTRALDEGIYTGLVDFRLENNFDPQEMQRMVACAAASIRHSARKRPKMRQIVRALEGDVSLDDLSDGKRPGQSSMFSFSASSPEYDQDSYNADLKKFRQIALSSQEFGDSDHGASSTDSRDFSPLAVQKHNP